MLTQSHRRVVKGFLGQTTAFNGSLLKSSVIKLGRVLSEDIYKYIHGRFGKGTFTFYGGHDPEDFSHAVEDPPTDLRLHKNSPGYRLILNNILFPAARPKTSKDIRNNIVDKAVYESEKLFQEGLEMYKKQLYSEALKRWKAVSSINHDYPNISMYINVCERQEVQTLTSIENVDMPVEDSEEVLVVDSVWESEKEFERYINENDFIKAEQCLELLLRIDLVIQQQWYF